MMEVIGRPRASLVMILVHSHDDYVLVLVKLAAMDIRDGFPLRARGLHVLG
jgi:hypothetical protein